MSSGGHNRERPIGQFHSEPIRLHPDNSHYLLFRGRPTVLIGSSEHYGSVMNRDFNYVRYLDTLQENGLNVTRLFSGHYRERPGKFGTLPQLLAGREDFEIVENTLAPNANAYLAPWPRSQEAGAADGLNKFDLSRWNAEYFERLGNVVREASRRGIVVEVSLFSPYYVNTVGDHFWELSPWRSRNNINGVGEIDGADALTLEDAKLLTVQETMVRKILTELRDFDNVYYEICNEPQWGHAAPEWQAHIAKLIVQTEASLGVRHLIMQEFADLSADVVGKISDPQTRQIYLANGMEKRLAEVSLLAFHSAQPRVVNENFSLHMPVGCNESVGIISDAANRISAWRILLAGGAFHHGTDYSFTRGHEDGSFRVPAGGAGGGSAELRKQLGILQRFMNGIEFIGMRPSPEVVGSALPDDAEALVLGKPGECYAIYISHTRPATPGGSLTLLDIDSTERQVSLQLNVPSGRYLARWLNTKTGVNGKEERFSSEGRSTTLMSPQYSEDIALTVNRLG